MFIIDPIEVNALSVFVDNPSQREPFTGEGKPEPLKGSPKGEWSRRINDKNRLVYIVSNENITITQCKGHYADQ